MSGKITKKEQEIINKFKKTSSKGQFELKNPISIDGVIFQKGDKIDLTKEQQKEFYGSFK